MTPETPYDNEREGLAVPGAAQQNAWATAARQGYLRALADVQPLIIAARRLLGYLYSTQNPGTLPKEYRDLEATLALWDKKE